MGWILVAMENDWSAVVGNLKKAQKSWAWLTRILGQEGDNPRISGVFFKAVKQAGLIFGSETCVLNPCMGRALGSFQHGVARRIMGIQPRRREEGGWEFLPLAIAMAEAGFGEIGFYI